MLLEIMSVVMALTLVVLAIFMIPVLKEVRRTSVALRNVAEAFEEEIKPLIQELRETVADVQVVTHLTAAKAEEVHVFLDELGHAGQNIRMINKVIGVASQVAAASSTWMTGARVAGKYITDRLIRKKGGD